MSLEMMSQRTTELLLLLHHDGVDSDELKALVGSAFQDGIAYTLNNFDDLGEQSS